jgi:glycosyltransferase involved in cell wall biosynthesis
MHTLKKCFIVWHWNKRFKGNPDRPIIAVEDTLLDALYQLAPNLDLRIIAISPDGTTSKEYFDTEHKIQYILRTSHTAITQYTRQHKPEVIIFNHHSQPYDTLIEQLVDVCEHSVIYYSAAIWLQFIDRLRFKYRNGLFSNPINHTFELIDEHIVQHAYQKQQLLKHTKIPEDRIHIAPKSANPNLFFPEPHVKKTWDVIYPGRCTERYLKRPELAIQATKKLSLTLCMPGARLKRSYSNVTVPKGWLDAPQLRAFYNQSKVLLITTNYREMGPRVIPEAMMCNLPVVCCSDALACVSHVQQIGGYIAKPTVHDISKKLLMALQTYTNTRDELLRLDHPNRIFTILVKILKEHAP